MCALVTGVHTCALPIYELRFKIYVLDLPVPLSDILPKLENMGLRVIGEVPFDIDVSDRKAPVWIHDFGMCAEGKGAIDLAAVRDAFHEAFARVWHGRMENDGFRSEEHTSELQSLMRISYAVFCLKKKKQPSPNPTHLH